MDLEFTNNVKEKYDHYYKYEEILKLLKGYAKAYPDYTKLNKIGKTLEGRDILLLEITNTKTGDFSSKPAFYVEGNLHAGEVTGSMTCMYFLDTIFTNIKSKEVKEILDTKTIYVLPRVSPDGSEYYLTTPDSVRSVNRFYPYSEEKEGLQPSDIDNDGVIRKMRVKDKFGIWAVSEKDPRAMRKRRPDEVEGEFYSVYSEGYIKGYDGFEVKSAPQKYAYDFNRNYTVDWKPENRQRGAGEYPLCNPETKANANFLLDHNNICLAVDMHTSGGQILYTPGCKPSKDSDRQDIKIYKEIGKLGTEVNGFPCINVYDEFGTPKDVTFGGFDDFCHMAVGIPCFTIECWDHANRAGIESHYPPIPLSDEVEEDNYIKYLKWLDEKYEGKGFKNWTKFNHPDLGEVEIGGFDFKYTIQNPPTKDLTEEISKHAKFFYRILKTFPNIKLTNKKFEKLSSDTYKLELTVENHGYMPSYVFKESLKLNRVPELKLSLEGCEIITGKKEESLGHLEGYSTTFGMNGEWGPMNMESGPLKKKLSYVIKAHENDTLKVSITGDRIGKLEETLKVK